MNTSLVTELVAVAIRNLPNNNIVRKPDAATEFWTTLFGGQTYDQRLAADVVNTAVEVVAVAKRVNVNRKFKKITKKF